jgi:O-antigen/teichoic acid export membrane protein
VFSTFSPFYGSAYLVFKKTGGAFSTTVVAAIINIVVGVGLIKWIGLFAPAFGTAVSFGVQWILRAHQMRDCFKVKIDLRSMLLLLVCGAVITFVYYMDSMLLQYLCMIGGIIVFLAINKEMVLMVLRKFRIIR